MLNRDAWLPGLPLGLQTVTVFPPNPPRTSPPQTIHDAVHHYDDDTGSISAFIDGVLLTKWKTASDSMLGARYLARPDSRKVLIIGSGTLARSLVESYSSIFPELEQITIWSRNPDNAQSLTNEMSVKGYRTTATPDLPQAAGLTNISSTATLSTSPVMKGE